MRDVPGSRVTYTYVILCTGHKREIYLEAQWSMRHVKPNWFLIRPTGRSTQDLLPKTVTMGEAKGTVFDICGHPCLPWTPPPRLHWESDVLGSEEMFKTRTNSHRLSGLFDSERFWHQLDTNVIFRKGNWNIFACLQSSSTRYFSIWSQPFYLKHTFRLKYY